MLWVILQPLTALGCGLVWGLFSASSEDGALAPALQEVLPPSLPWRKDRPVLIKKRHSLAAEQCSGGHTITQRFSKLCVGFSEAESMQGWFLC